MKAETEGKETKSKDVHPHLQKKKKPMFVRKRLMKGKGEEGGRDERQAHGAKVLIRV